MANGTLADSSRGAGLCGTETSAERKGRVSRVSKVGQRGEGGRWLTLRVRGMVRVKADMAMMSCCSFGL